MTIAGTLAERIASVRYDDLPDEALIGRVLQSSTR